MTANQLLYLSFALIILIGISLTGFKEVHWLLYIPLVFATFAGITGFCVNLWFWKKLGFKEVAQCSTKTE